MTRLVFLPVVLALVSGCVSLQRAPAATTEALEAARLADLLTQTAQDSPDRVREAGQEMAALEQALTASSLAAPSANSSSTPVQRRAAAPDLSGAQSLLSAVHLASYRVRNNAVIGWSSLQADVPDVLGPLEARVSSVDLGERGVFLRLKAGPIDSPSQARAVCAQLEVAGHWCTPTDFTGESLPHAVD